MEVFFTLAAIAVIILIVILVINSNKEDKTSENRERYEQDYKDNHMEKYVNQYLEAHRINSPSDIDDLRSKIYDEEIDADLDFEEENLEELPFELDKSAVIKVLHTEIEKKLLAEAKHEVIENPNRDDTLQTQFVIHKLESLGKEIEVKMIEDRNYYNLSETEIADLIHDCIGNVLKVIFKGLI